MKIYRYIEDGALRYAVSDGQRVRRSSAATLFEIARAPRADAGDEISLEDLTLAAPLTPGKIVAVGRNYADHARELGNEPPAEPILFMKPPSAVIGPEASIELPAASAQVNFEGELALVVGKRCRRIEREQWREYILGFTCANDVTARDLQKKDVQFTRGKSFDTFAPIGPSIETELDVADLALTTRLNGEIRQNGRTSQMIFPPGELVVFISAIMTLEPGDLILTGTPAGVGAMRDGDLVEVEIEGIGTLRNRVQRAE